MNHYYGGPCKHFGRTEWGCYGATYMCGANEQ